MRRANVRLLGSALMALAIVVPRSAAAGQTTIFVNYDGFNFCDVCGVADYATVSGGLQDRTFADPLPAGAVPTQIIANIQGTCDDTVSLTIDGTFIGTSTFSGTGCACGSCFDGSLATSESYPGGFPGWVAGGTQVLHIDAPAAAIDGVDVTIVYRVCGDGVTEGSEACDTAGDSPTCDADCTAATCGDGHPNLAAGEACDTAGESAGCDGDCSIAMCGDGHVNAAAGEACDVSVENAACDSDCTLADCGDGHPNAAAGEACDDGNDVDGDGCSTSCQIEGGPTSSSTGEGPGVGGAGGEGPGGGASGPTGSGGEGPGSGGGGPSGPTGGGGEGGDGTSGPSGPTGSGIAVVSGVGAGGRDRDDDGDDDEDDGDGNDDGDEGGASGDAARSGDTGGCGCRMPVRDEAPLGRAGAFIVLLGAALWRVGARRAAGARR